MKTTQTIQLALAEDASKFDTALDADLTFFDPPYNIGIDYGKHPEPSDKRSKIEYLNAVRTWVSTGIDCTRTGGVLAVLISEEYASHYDLILESFPTLKKINRIIWRERFAQYSERKFVNEHRHLFLYRVTKPGANGESIWNNGDEIRVPSVRMELGDKRAKGLRVPGDVWECPRLPGNARARVDWHPCQLHPSPLKRIVYAFTNEGGRVTELFSGSGSLAVVCKELNRNYFGCDASERFVREARKRIEEHKS